MANSNKNEVRRQDIRTALQAFQTKPLREAAIALLNTLDYRSDKTAEIPDSNPQAFLDWLSEHSKDTEFKKDKALFDDWLRADMVFQLTDEELTHENRLFKNDEVNTGLLQSYLFFAIELKHRDYARGKLTDLARQLNRVFPMPVMVFIKHHDQLSIAVINRRRNKRDADRDVLGKVTIIRDIALTSPHRGHLDILQSFSLFSLRERTSIHNFDTLHAAWEAIFNVELLNERFYKDLFKWYFWALPEVRFPDDRKPANLTGTQEASHDEKQRATGLIRLLTRLIFCWFLKEKGLIPETLFDKQALAGMLKELDDDKPTYHLAILQNLFFATLNQRMGEDEKGKPYRHYAKDEGFLKNRNTYGVDNLYRYESLFKDPETALQAFADIPFLNGGLFECLDHLDDNGRKIYVDGFSRNSRKCPHIPNRFFFGEGEINLGEVTGEKRRSTERAKGLVHILSDYKFTIVENTPIDQEIALDPELLGKVFENLLASYNEETQTTARKQTGSFYTPRPIVDYMVDESLKAHLATVLNREQNMTEADARTGLDILFAYTEKQHAFNDSEVDTLIKAIDTCKILDPACGSGAFPMGMLHKLVFILTKLDPDNVRWKQTQLDKLDSAPMCEELERIFADNNDDYGRKLYLIENCLYGVDIQPIAIQLSKLRFFISLICDQKTNINKAQNQGVRPLPNLETKLVAANTLIGLGQIQMGLIDPEVAREIARIEEQLQKVRHDHFAAQTRQKKLSLQKKDKQLRKELAEALTEAQFANQETSQKLANWNPYDPHIVADFFEPIRMFDRSVEGGFDVVIGNPPYVQLQKNSDALRRLYQSADFEVFARTGDIYCLFYEKGVGLLKQRGHLCYITSNKWMRAQYGEELRRFLAHKTNLVQLLDFGGFQVFENATVDTNILLAQKIKGNGQLRATKFKSDFSKGGSIRQYTENNMVEINVTNDTWVIGSRSEVTLKEKIERIGTPLKDWDISINYGIKTGYNKAFIIDNETKDALIRQDPRSNEIIRPVLRGRDIKRYQAEWAGLWLIATLPSLHIDIENYPAIKRHLLSYGKDRLEQAGKILADGSKSRKKTPHRWFELQDTCAYHAEFDREKIVYPNMTKFLPFVFDRTGKFINDKGFIITGGNLKFLIGILNSKLGTKWLQDNCPELQGGTRELRKVFVENFCAPRVNSENRNLVSKIEFLVDRVFSAKNHVTDTIKLEEEINVLVYNLYGLTDVEIRLIESD